MADAGPRIARLKAALAAAAAASTSPPAGTSTRPSAPGAAAHGGSSNEMVVLQDGVQQHLHRVREAKRGEGSSSLRERQHHHHRPHKEDGQQQQQSTVPADSLRELRRRFKVLARHRHLRKREGRLLDSEELGVVGQHLQAVYSTPLPKPTTNDDGDEYPAAPTIGRCNYDDFGRLKLQVPVAARRYFDWEHFLEVRH